MGWGEPLREAAAAGQPPWRMLARQAARRGKRVAGVLAVGAGPGAAAAEGAEGRESPADFQELWEERTAIMVYDGRLPPTEGGEAMPTALWRRGRVACSKA